MNFIPEPSSVILLLGGCRDGYPCSTFASGDDVCVRTRANCKQPDSWLTMGQSDQNKKEAPQAQFDPAGAFSVRLGLHQAIGTLISSRWRSTGLLSAARHGQFPADSLAREWAEARTQGSVLTKQPTRASVPSVGRCLRLARPSAAKVGSTHRPKLTRVFMIVWNSGRDSRSLDVGVGLDLARPAWGWYRSPRARARSCGRGNSGSSGRVRPARACHRRRPG